MTVEIIYETHQLSTDNEAGIATGWLPGELSERGRLEATWLGERRRGDRLAAIYSSDLARAVETVEIAFGGSGLPVIQDVRLRECNYGDLNGAPREQIDRERLRRIREPFSNGQSYEQVVAGMSSFLNDIADRHQGETVLIVAHSANRWALDHLLHGVALEDLVDAPFDWQEGWCYTLTDDWNT